MWRYLLPIGVLVVIVGFFYRGLYLNPGFVPSPLLGKPAPEYDLPRLKDPSRSRLAIGDFRLDYPAGCPVGVGGSSP